VTATPSTLRICALLLAISMVYGCIPRRPRPDVAHPDLSVKIPSYVIAVERGNHSVVPRLIHDLDDSDPAVRFYAIEALYRLTGERFEYNYFSREAERREAVQRWRRWLQQQQEPEESSEHDATLVPQT
jgi:hypothetical protein